MPNNLVYLYYPHYTQGLASAQTVTLTSSVEQDGRQAACPGEVVTFTCMVTEAGSLQWTSDRFQSIRFLSNAAEQSEVDQGEFHAVLTSNVGGGLFRNLTSTLRVNASITLNGVIIHCIIPGAAISSNTLNFASKSRQACEECYMIGSKSIIYSFYFITLPSPTLSSPAAKLLCFTIPPE